jgi:charged multivesicular body protein 6
LLLKKKRYYEQNLDKTDGQLDNLDQMVHNIEYTQIEHQVINGLKVGNDCLKKLNEMMSLDEVEQIMDDTRESIEYQRVYRIFLEFLKSNKNNKHINLN